MLVIGVAEPDNGAADAAEASAKQKHIEFENQVGRWLFLTNSILDSAVVWGVNGMRQRVLVRSGKYTHQFLGANPFAQLYKKFASAPFHELFSRVRTQQSISSYWFSGLPTFVLNAALQEVPIAEFAAQISIPRLERVDEKLVLKSRKWTTPHAFRRAVRSAATYVRLHLEIFTFMQRVGLISARAILPHWKFFVPGSSASPIFVPPLPTSFTTQDISSWVARCAAGILPFASYYLCSLGYRYIASAVYSIVLYTLPFPINLKEKQRKVKSEPVCDWYEEPPRNGGDMARDQSDVRVLEGQPQNESLPVGGTRRQSTISVRGDDFASDDEEGDIISATLISFDVEATETTDSTPGVWSAELRPNMSDAKPDQGPKYRETTLVRLLPILAANLLGAASTRLLVANEEGLIWCMLGRAYLTNRGLPTDSLCAPTVIPFFGLDWRRWFSIVGLESMFLSLQGGIWLVMAAVARRYSYTEAEWNKRLGITTAGEDN